MRRTCQNHVDPRQIHASPGPGPSVGMSQRTAVAGVPGRAPKLMVIGTAAGLFSGLFGVGGGTVIVPLLVFWLGYGAREATGTSLAAIVFIAGFAGAFSQNRYGNVRRDDALLMGVLSIAGVAGGVALANALSGAVLRTAFAVLILLIAAQLVRRALHENGGGANPDELGSVRSE